jgi:N-methylhydantoinase A
VERLAATLADMAPERLADGIVRIAVARMTSSIREISVERGHDPRDFTLVAFGGAGPMHAIPVAEELGIRRVLVPRHPGNFSALGLLVADVKHDDVRTRLGPLRQAATIVETALADMEAAARARLADDGFATDGLRIERSLDLRYLGQAFELNVPLPHGADDLASVTRDFHERHRLAYGYAHPEGDVELVNVRIAAYGVVDKPEPPPYRSGTNRVEDAVIEERDVWLVGAPVRCAVYERDRLPESAIVTGPAIVEEFGATTVVFPRWRAALDHLGNLHLQSSTHS